MSCCPHLAESLQDLVMALMVAMREVEAQHIQARIQQLQAHEFSASRRRERLKPKRARHNSVPSSCVHRAGPGRCRSRARAESGLGRKCRTGWSEHVKALQT